MRAETRERILALAFAIYAVSTLVSMAVMSVGAALLGIAWVVYARGPRGVGAALAEEWTRWSSRRYLYLALVLALACALSLAVAWVFPLGYAGRSVQVSFLRDMGKVWYLFWPLVLATGFRALPEAARTRVLRAWLLAFGALSALGLLQYFIGWPRPQMIPGNEPRYHVTLFLGHHLSVASIFIFPFFAALDLASRPDGARLSGLSRRALVAIVGVGALALLWTHSRMLWVALPVGLLVWGIWSLPRRWAMGVSAAVAIAALAGFQLPVVQRRLADSFGLTTRTRLWQANLEFFKERPLTGAGWRHNQELSGYYFMSVDPGSERHFSGHAHNNLIDMLGGLGLVGAIAWLLWCVGVIRLLPSGGFARGLACAWIVFHINGLTQLNFWEGKVMHQMMWAVAWSLFWAGGGAIASKPPSRERKA